MCAFSLKFSIAPSGETTHRIKKGAKMVRTASVNMPSMVVIVGRTLAVDEKCDYTKNYHFRDFEAVPL